MRNTILAVAAFLIISCASLNTMPYDLDTPAKEIILPDTLREVSDISMIGDNKIACIQDENGIVFIVNSNNGEIEKQIPFASDGDYEGLAVVDRDIYALRSDGMLYQIIDYNSGKPEVKIFPTGVPAKDNEGLCYDKTHNRLLIAAKGKSGKGHAYKSIREIFAFNLAEKKLDEKPAYTFYLDDILQFAATNHVPLPVKPAKKKKPAEVQFRFTTSAIGIKEDSNELYLISSMDRVLMVFNTDGQLKNMKLLEKDLFNKAEGLTFTKNGELLISNEGQKGKPRVLVFKRG
jgi:uncharacterized protein YjiK